MSEIKVNAELLDLTQNKRRELLEKIEAIPKFEMDSETVGAYVRVLDGMDKQELTKAKIKSDEEQGDKNRAAVQAARQLASSFTRNRENPFMQKRVGGAPQDDKIPTINVEDDIVAAVIPGQPSQSWKDFEAKMEEKENQEKE